MRGRNHESSRAAGGGDGHGDDHARRAMMPSRPGGRCARAGGASVRSRSSTRPAFATRIAAEVEGFRLADYRPDAARWRDHCRTTQFALAAATMAMEHAGLEDAPLDRARVRRLSRLGRGAAGLRSLRRPGPSLDRDGRVDTARFTSLGLQSLHPTREAEQEAGTAGRAPGGRLRRPGAERDVPDGVRRQRPGDRRGGRVDPPRRRRRDARRRHRQHDPPARPHRVHPPDGDVDPQRRPRRGRAGRSTATATASCSAREAACSSSRSWSMPGPEGPSSTARSPATARRPTPSA